MKIKTDKRINYLLLTCAITIIIFIVVFGLMLKPDYSNLGGTHSWLSGSTLKFVNNWLKDGALKLKFTNFESFDSIEFNSLYERAPYVSYPTGTTFFVWLFAKLFGRAGIDITFLKTFQMFCFGISSAFFAGFIYVLISRTTELPEKVKILISIIQTLLWMILPNNAWYLCNIYFADQCIIMWVMIFIFLEYIESWELVKHKKLIICFKAICICFGVLIDYYFWILVFFAFVFDFIKQKSFKHSLSYIIPVVLSVLTFFIQIRTVPNWQNKIKDIFIFRTTGAVENGIWNTIKAHFISAFCNGKEFAFIILLLFIVAIIICGIICLKKNDWKFLSCIKDDSFSLIVVGIISPIIQIVLLKNHTANHEFSMLKFGWIIALLNVFLPIFIYKMCKWKKKKNNRFYMAYVLSLVLMIILIGVPGATTRFSSLRYSKPSYQLERIIKNNTSFEDVCFSNTKEIDLVPPQSLAISEKQVYHIDTIEDIDSRFPNLNPMAKKILIIEKAKTEYQGEGKIRYEDDDYLLIEIK